MALLQMEFRPWPQLFQSFLLAAFLWMRSRCSQILQSQFHGIPVYPAKKYCNGCKSSFKYNQQDVTLYNTLYYCQCSTCFRRFLHPSSGAQNCTHSMGCLLLPLATPCSVRRTLHGTQHTHHNLKHMLPQHCKNYNDVFLLIKTTKV
jgi:hypothetical protein